LSLAEEYFDAAHSQGTTTALGWKEAEMEEYYKLVATGLGCLEVVLKVCYDTRGLRIDMLTGTRIGDYNHAERRWCGYSMRGFYSKRRKMIMRQRQLLAKGYVFLLFSCTLHHH
jgi:hypothetical protein